MHNLNDQNGFSSQKFVCKELYKIQLGYLGAFKEKSLQQRSNNHNLQNYYEYRRLETVDVDNIVGPSNDFNENHYF